MKHTLFAMLFLGLLNSFCFAQTTDKEPYKHPPGFGQKKCSECHDMREGNEYFHMPVKQGACGACHVVPSTAPNKLRIQNFVEMCVPCHGPKRRIIRGDINVHPPAKQGCTNCHDPHAGKHQFRLKADRRKDICLTCHTEKKEWVNNVKNKHGAIFLEDGGCIACHDPHGTTRPKMLKAENTKDLCLRCHSKPLKRQEDGKMLLDIGQHLMNNEKWHGPIIDGECTGCHNPHGSNNHRMLKRPFPTTSTTAFAPEKYVCFKCHPSEKVTEKYTTTFTNYRKGEKNLHNIHVEVSLITCGTCHDFHGVDRQVPLVKKRTNFGLGTVFDLRFRKTKDGGSCNPICHKRREYKRSAITPR